MCDPALILVAELPWAVDAAHAHDRGTETKDSRIVARILVGSALGAAIRAVKIQQSALRDSLVEPRVRGHIAQTPSPDLGIVDHTSIHLLGRSTQHRR